MKTKPQFFQLNENGDVERVSPFGCFGPAVQARNKSEATAKFLAFAYRAAENTPRVKIRNGAYQLSFESLNSGVTVESGIEGRNGALCCAGAKDMASVTDETASFAYYASEEYRKAAA